MSIAVLGSLLAVDTRAEASFDAPKRLLALVGAVVCAIALLGWAGGNPGVPRSARRLVAAISGIAAILLAVVSSFLSPHRSIAVDSLRTILLFTLVIAIGAFFAAGARFWRTIIGCLLIGNAINAVISLMQAFGGLQLFSYATVGGRANVSALMGNDGLLALSMAIAAVIALERMLTPRASKRPLYVLLFVLYVGTILLNRNATAIVAVAAAAMFIGGRQFGWKRAVAVALVSAVVFVGAAALLSPARGRIREIVTSGSAGAWNEVLSYRLGAWYAAGEMIRERPLLGWGPGTFGAEFVPHLLRAELSHRTKLSNPFLSGAYVEAHSDYLQLAAECGLLAAVLVALAMSVTMATAISVAPREQRQHVTLMVSIVLVGAIAALTWFPMQRPAIALPMLLAIGALWRASAAAEVAR